jgi:hypothetical protein
MLQTKPQSCHQADSPARIEVKPNLMDGRVTYKLSSKMRSTLEYNKSHMSFLSQTSAERTFSHRSIHLRLCLDSSPSPIIVALFDCIGLVPSHSGEPAWPQTRRPTTRAQTLPRRPTSPLKTKSMTSPPPLSLRRICNRCHYTPDTLLAKLQRRPQALVIITRQ